MEDEICEDCKAYEKEVEALEEKINCFKERIDELEKVTNEVVKRIESFSLDIVYDLKRL